MSGKWSIISVHANVSNRKLASESVGLKLEAERAAADEVSFSTSLEVEKELKSAGVLT